MTDKKFFCKFVEKDKDMGYKERLEKKKELIELAMQASEYCENTRIQLSGVSLQGQRMYHLVRSYPGMSGYELMEKFSASESTVRRYLAELVYFKLVKRIGSRKTGGYFITETEADKLLHKPKCRHCVIYRSHRPF